jgi:hypothetical protein
MMLTMKRDGRTLDHATLEAIRKMAVQRVREGERPSLQTVMKMGQNTAYLSA